jgi:hypothetical protein
VHNQVAALYNSRKYKEAKNILDSAIIVYPGSQTFSQDLGLVAKALGQ